MSVFSGLKFIFSTSRGAKKIFARLYTVKKRFGFGPKKQIGFIRYYISVLKDCGAKGTFFIPAKILKRHIQYIKGIQSDNIEWGIHGYAHTDFSRLTLGEQKLHIDNAILIFDRLGIEFRGFRSPYLRQNPGTLKAIIESNRFLYCSNNSILWDEIYSKDTGHGKWIRDFCHPFLHSACPSISKKHNGIIEIPVSLPDDDVLLDREKFSPDKILSLWLDMLKICHERNEVFTLQLHPERIYELDNVLKKLIEAAKKSNPPLWITTLGELAKWQAQQGIENRICPPIYRGAFCITGDIDSITIGDFINRLKEW